MPTFAAAAVLFSTVFGATSEIPTVRVVLDTDLGDDIDDTWALSALLQSPAVDLRLIVTDSYGSQSRANALAKFLRLAGKLAEVPVIAIGPEQTGATIMDSWANASDLDQFPGQLRFDAAEAIIEQVEASVEDKVPLQILVLSPSAAVAAAIQKAPWITNKAQISAMGGSLWHGTNGTGPPRAEWNVRADMPSSRVVYPHVTTLCPLDVAGAAQIDGAQYQQLLHCKPPGKCKENGCCMPSSRRDSSKRKRRGNATGVTITSPGSSRNWRRPRQELQPPNHPHGT